MTSRSMEESSKCGRSDASEERKKWREEITKMKEENAAVKKKYMDLVSKCTERLNRLEFFQKKVKTMEESKTVLEGKIKDLETWNRTLLDNAQIILEQKRDLEKKNSELEKGNSEVIKKQLEKRVQQSFMEEKNVLEGKNKELEERARLLLQQKEDLGRQNGELKKKVENLMKEEKELEGSKKKLEDNRDILEELNKHLAKIKAEMSNENKKLSDANTVLAASNSKLEEQVRDLEAQMKGLVEGTNAEMEEKNKNLEERIEALQERNRFLEEKKSSLEKLYISQEETIKDYSQLEKDKSCFRDQLNAKIRSEWFLHTKIKEKDYHIVQLQIELQAVEEKNESLTLENSQLITALLDVQEEIKRLRQEKETQSDDQILENSLKTENRQLSECKQTLTEEKLQLEKELAVISAKMQNVEDVFDKFKRQCCVRDSNALDLFSFISDFISSRFSTLENFCDKMEVLNGSKLEETAMEPPPKHNAKIVEAADVDLEIVEVISKKKENQKKEVKNSEKSGRSEDREKREKQLQRENRKLVESNNSLMEENLKLLEAVAVLNDQKRRLEETFEKFQSKMGGERKWESHSEFDNFCDTKEVVKSSEPEDSIKCQVLMDAIKSLEKRNASLEALNKDLEEKASILKILSKTQEESLKELSHLEEENVTLKHELNRKTRSERCLKEKIKELVVESTNKMKAQKEAVARRRKERCSLQLPLPQNEATYKLLLEEALQLEQEVLHLTGEKEALEDEKWKLVQSNHFMEQEIYQLEGRVKVLAETILSIEKLAEKFRSECHPGETVRKGRSALELFTFISGLITSRFSSLDEFVEKLKQLDPEPHNKCNLLEGVKLQLEKKVTALTGKKFELEQKIGGIIEEKRQLQKDVDSIALKLLQRQVEVDTLIGEKKRFEHIFDSFRTNCEIGNGQGTTPLELFEFITKFISSRFPCLKTFCDKLEAVCIPKIQDDLNGPPLQDEDQEVSGDNELTTFNAIKKKANLISPNLQKSRRIVTKYKNRKTEAIKKHRNAQLQKDEEPEKSQSNQMTPVLTAEKPNAEVVAEFGKEDGKEETKEGGSGVKVEETRSLEQHETEQPSSSSPPIENVEIPKDAGVETQSRKRYLPDVLSEDSCATKQQKQEAVVVGPGSSVDKAPAASMSSQVVKISYVNSEDDEDVDVD